MVCSLTAGCALWQPKSHAGTVARVNGRTITRATLDRWYARQMGAFTGQMDAAQADRLRLSLVDELINREVMLQYAARQRITATPAEIAEQLPAARVRMPESSADELTRQVAEDTVLDKLLAREVTQQIHVSDAEINDFFNRNRAAFSVTEPQYHLQQIVITPGSPGAAEPPQPRAVAERQAAERAQMVETRLRGGADFSQMAEQFSDPDTAASGGDLGLVPRSALQSQTPAPLRQAILSLRPGQFSPVIKTSSGYAIVRLVSIDEPGQRNAGDPRLRQDIRDTITHSREQVLKAAFMSTLRDQAKVENYFAEDLLASGGTRP